MATFYCPPIHAASIMITYASHTYKICMIATRLPTVLMTNIHFEIHYQMHAIKWKPNWQIQLHNTKTWSIQRQCFFMQINYQTFGHSQLLLFKFYKNLALKSILWFHVLWLYLYWFHVLWLYLYAFFWKLITF